FAEVSPLGSDVAIVEAEVGGLQFLDELEGDADTLDGHLDRIAAVFPRSAIAAGPERIAAGAAEGVPVADGAAEVVLHRFAFDRFRRIVMAEGERVLGIGAFVLDGADVWKECHGDHLGCGMEFSIVLWTRRVFANGGEPERK